MAIPAAITAAASIGVAIIEGIEGWHSPPPDDNWWPLYIGSQSQNHQQQTGRDGLLRMWYDGYAQCVSVKATRQSSHASHMEGTLAVMVPGRKDPLWQRHWRDDNKHGEGLDQTFCEDHVYDFSNGFVLVTSMKCGSFIGGCGSTTRMDVNLDVGAPDVTSCSAHVDNVVWNMTLHGSASSTCCECLGAAFFDEDHPDDFWQRCREKKCFLDALLPFQGWTIDGNLTSFSLSISTNGARCDGTRCSIREYQDNDYDGPTGWSTITWVDVPDFDRCCDLWRTCAYERQDNLTDNCSAADSSFPTYASGCTSEDYESNYCVIWEYDVAQSAYEHIVVPAQMLV